MYQLIKFLLYVFCVFASAIMVVVEGKVLGIFIIWFVVSVVQLDKFKGDDDDNSGKD